MVEINIVNQLYVNEIHFKKIKIKKLRLRKLHDLPKVSPWVITMGYFLLQLSKKTNPNWSRC